MLSVFLSYISYMFWLFLYFLYVSTFMFTDTDQWEILSESDMDQSESLSDSEYSKVVRLISQDFDLNMIRRGGEII